MTIVLLSSCSDYLKGKPFKSNHLEIKSQPELACLDNVSADMQRFLNAEGANSDVDKTVNCINDTLTLLQVKVEGRVESTAFTSDEVYSILAQFASGANISRDAAHNMILLKAALLGGEKSKITKAEIDSLKNYLLIVKEEAKKIRPYIKVFYFKNTDRLYTKSYLQESFAQLNSSLKVLYRASQLGSSNYSVENFKEMMINVFSLSDDSRAMAEIMSKMSKILSGSNGILTESERYIYLDNVRELLTIYSYYVNGYVKFEISTSSNLNEIFELTDSIINLIESTLQYRKTQIISSQTIDGFISALTNSNVLNKKMTAYTLAMFYRTMIVRVFESGTQGAPLSFIGLKSFHLKNIKRELATYKIYSKMIERVAGESLFALRGITSAPLRELQLALGQLNIASETEILNSFDYTTQSQIINNVNELRSEFLGSSPIIYNKNKIGLVLNQNSWGQKWQDLARGLYVKMLARLLMQGWGKIYPVENLAMTYMTELDLFNWYSEFKSFGIEFKILDPRKYNSGSAAFNTANLFSRIGNGDDKVNFREVVENLGVVVSSSSMYYNELKSDLFENNCNLPALDVFDEHWNNEQCFHQTISSNYKKYYSSLGHLSAYLDSLNADQFKQFFSSALDVVRLEPQNSGSQVETADMFSMNSLFHFIENVYLIHDKNVNGHISEAEIREAYPKFEKIATVFAYQNSRQAIEDFTSWKGNAAGYGCFTEPDLIRESFIFLVFNGRTPEQSDFNTLPCFRGKPLLNFYGEIDRMKLLNTFKSLKSALGI